MYVSRSPITRLCLFLLSLLLFGAHHVAAQAAPTMTDPLDQFLAQNTITVPLTTWKFSQTDIRGGEAVNLDDFAWQTAAPGFSWKGENTNVWFRTRYVVPATVGGVSTEGRLLRLEVGMDDSVEIYIDGKLITRSDWDDGHIDLAKSVHPGQVFNIALRGINGPGDGQLHFARMVYNLLGPVEPGYSQIINQGHFLQQVIPQATGDEQSRLSQTLGQAVNQVDLASLRAHDWAKGGASVKTAEQTLLTLAPITKQYDVYYVGHAHIDMNWLWTWPETIDVAHRTWDSAMKLMDQFPDFGFVQSQPGVYVPIQQQYPAEFARMQQKEKKGQWNIVGGMWDESDDNLPSGEALARSFFLGQRYFKKYFGHYVTTGWLPDSFGHSWQMPQLMQQAGIVAFYHMRPSGDNFSWWESPDGSRVLKAWTGNYDEPILPEQLLRPWQNAQNYGLKQALVVFGVGDHGGGPTRQQILHGKEFQADPLFPKVHFVTADAYFKHLRTEDLSNLPVVATDMQNVSPGGYSTHADIKKAVRHSENNLYTAEVFSSLAAMRGQPYPLADFTKAWEPTTFAQFHDIMCGTAIHSTYDWMHQQLAPAFAFEQAQIDKTLTALTASIDTRGARAGEQPVAVWNALSFPYTDVVRLPVANAASYGSVRDAAGHVLPVQTVDAGTLAFVAADIPAFGQKLYFLSKNRPQGTVPTLATDGSDHIALSNRFLRVMLAKDTGLITSLFDITTGKEMIATGHPGNLLQVLGDKANVWGVELTGEQHDLTTGADVQLITSGPVFAVVRVKHTYGSSTFMQDVTLYNDLPRVDVPSTVDWHEHSQTLKVAFPLAFAHPAARVGIPYGSIERANDGLETPGQKWMDVSETTYTPSNTPTTMLSLAGLYNDRSSVNFDTENRALGRETLPAAGVQRLGTQQIPFTLPGETGLDNIAPSGQVVSIPTGAQGRTLYLLAASAPGARTGSLKAETTDGKSSGVSYTVGDWTVGGGLRNENGLTLPYQITENGTQNPASKPHLWIVAVPLPAGETLKNVVLQPNPRIHIFAMTLGGAATETPQYGFTVLNDCKYGSDTNDNVFRLTLLRSPDRLNDPDRRTDEGMQTFTYSLMPHAGDSRTAQSEQAGLGFNIGLHPVLTTAHVGKTGPQVAIEASGNIVAGALKHDEDGTGYILRVFETQGRNSTVRIRFSQAVKVQETDILERPVQKRKITTQGKVVSFPVGHDQIVTLHITGLPDANTSMRSANAAIDAAR